MNAKILLTATIVTTSLFFSSCKKDDDTAAKPEITLNEVGANNSKIAIIGSDLHIEADIVASGTIDNVTVEIHPEAGGTWQFDTTFTEFSGRKNGTFHKHIDIPLDADEGEYHLHLTVNDMAGGQTVAESELEIQTPSDSVAPAITISSAPANQSFSKGEMISISGTISDNISLGGVYIALVRKDQNLSDAEINATNTITIMHTHDFENKTAHTFSASIAVGAPQDNNIAPKDIAGDIAWQSGTYYVLVKSKDMYGGNWTFSDHYPLTINY